MDKFLGLAWLVATVTSWISFGFASWRWAENRDSGMLMLTILWFVISLTLFLIGLRLGRRSS